MSTETDSITTLSAHLDHVDSLNAQAKELMPFKVDECSYEQGYVRQKVWSCRTCAGKGDGDGEVGVCYACSVSCHAEHDLVELFTRRHFKCDCPTLHCSLLPTRKPQNTENTYGKNFRGEFCRCERGKRYDPMEEAESMVMCLACEDWFHESCLNLQDPTNPTPLNDAASTSSSSESGESPLLPESSYQHLICAACVLASPLVRRYAGTDGWMMVVPKPAREEEVPWAERWVVVGRDAEVGEKRKAGDDEASETKRTKLTVSDTSYGSTSRKACTMPMPNPVAREIINALSNNPGTTAAKGDVFLRPDALESICTCESCTPLVNALPFPVVEEPEYLPAPEDPNDPSEEELTSQALERLPRGQTIEALLAFNSMKDKLKAFLEPFRDGGRVVSAGDIEEFMQGIKESRGR